MDPNANLEEQESLLTAEGVDLDIFRIRDLRHALDEWLAKGGFQPEWERYPVAARDFRAWQHLEGR